MTRFFGGDQRVSNFARINRMLQPRPASSSFWTTSMSNSTTTFEATGGPAGIATPWVKCALTSGTATGFATLNQNLLDRFPVVAGKDFTASMYIFLTKAPTGRAAPFVTFYDDDGVQVSQVTPSIAPGAINTWNRVSNTFTPPAGATVARLGASIGEVTTFVVGDYWGVAGVMAEDGDALLAYFDGGSSGAMWSQETNTSESWRNAL